MTDEARRTRREGIAELAEDAVGFGGQELRLTRDLLLRPRAVMDAYDAHGSTAGGLYPKPLRYWLTINGLYLLVSALAGGLERALQPSGARSQEGMTKIAAAAGKSVDEFQGDLEQWYSLVSLPLYALFMGGGLFLLFRRWSPGDDRQDFRQTFTFLNGYTVLVIPLGLITVVLPTAYMAWAIPLSFAVIAITFSRMGRDRWWRTSAGAWVKGTVLVAVAALALIPFGLIAALIAFAAAYALP